MRPAITTCTPLIDGVVELLDDTTVTLDGYVTETIWLRRSTVVGGGAVYTGTKTDLKATDASVIEAYFTEHSGITPRPEICLLWSLWWTASPMR